MLRMILCSGRKVLGREESGPVLESWVDWFRRTTDAAEERFQKLRLRDWVTAHHQAKKKLLAQTLDQGTWVHLGIPLATRRTEATGETEKTMGVVSTDWALFQFSMVLRRHVRSPHAGRLADMRTCTCTCTPLYPPPF